MTRLQHPLLSRLPWFALLLLALQPKAVRGSSDDFEPGYIQIKAAAGVSINQINALYETTTSDSLPPLYRLYVPHGVDEDTLLAQMNLDSEHVAAAEHCFRSNTPEGLRQMVVAAVGGTIDDYLDQDVVNRIHLPEAHHFTEGEGITVAVLDTGVRLDHPALDGVIRGDGWDFVQNDADPSDTANGFDDDADGQVDEGAGHGTMVAGIVHLVAPSAQILPVRVLNDEGRGQTFQVARGIRYAVEHGARVINLSLGLHYHSEILAHELAAARDAGLAIVAAAGNDSTDSLLVYPAADSTAFMVTALDSADVKADFSNWGPKVEVSAPGVGIRAPYHDGEWAIGAGTSFATPFVAGECALLLAMEPSYGWESVRQRVRESVVDIYDLPPNQPYLDQLGTGRMDGYQLLVHSRFAAGVEQDGELAAGPLRAWPNPVPPGRDLQVGWDLPSLSEATPAVAVFDARGRRVVSLSAPSASAGGLRWDGRDARGRPVAAGLYYLRLDPNANAAGGASVLILR